MSMADFLGYSRIARAREDIDEILESLKGRLYLDYDIEDLEQLQTRLKEGVTWVSKGLRDMRDDSDLDETEDIIDESLALEPECDASPDKLTPPPTTMTTPTVSSIIKDTQPDIPTQTLTRTVSPTPNGTKQPNTEARRNPATRHQKKRPHTRTQNYGRNTTTGPSTRLVVRFPGQTIPAEVRPHPATFRDELNKAINMKAIESIQYSRTGQLILQTRSPHTAVQLAALSNQLWPVIQAALRIGDTPERPIFEPDDTWTRIVVHQVPLPVWDGKRDSRATQELMTQDLCHTNSIPAETIRRVH